MDELDAGTIRAVTPTLFDMADGVRSNECNGGNQAAGCRTRDGRLWLPTMRGFVVFDPKVLKVNQVPPAVFIEEVMIDGDPLDPGRRALQPPGRGELEFHYTALSFLTPERARFQYRLDGYDRDWVEAGSRRAAYYTNIPPGAYRFRVKACSEDGIWNEAGATFAFDLRPHFYQTGWFYVVGALGVVVVALAGGSHTLRVRHLRAREKELARRVEERTGELRQEIRERQQAEAAARQAQEAAEANLAQVKRLRGLLPICSYCKKIRDDQNYWHQVEAYLSDHSDAKFSHGICPDC